MLLILFVMSHDLLHPFPLPLPVPSSIVDTDEVDIPQVYTIEDAADSELEAGRKVACKVSPGHMTHFIHHMTASLGC